MSRSAKDEDYQGYSNLSLFFISFFLSLIDVRSPETRTIVDRQIDFVCAKRSWMDKKTREPAALINVGRARKNIQADFIVGHYGLEYDRVRLRQYATTPLTGRPIRNDATPRVRDSLKLKSEKNISTTRDIYLSFFFLILSAYFYFAGDASLCADEDGGYYDNLLTSPASRFPGPVGGVSTPAGFASRRAKSQ